MVLTTLRYLLSYIHVSLGAFLVWSGTVTVKWLRYLNFELGTILMPFAIYGTLRPIADRIDCSKHAMSERQKWQLGWSEGIFWHTALNICLFPPLFFFNGLYYTDVASALFTLWAFSSFLRGRVIRFVIHGLLALSFRQTNIFWVSVYMGAFSIVFAFDFGRVNVEYPEKPTIWDIVTGTQQHGCIYTPLAAHAGFKGLAVSSCLLLC